MWLLTAKLVFKECVCGETPKDEVCQAHGYLHTDHSAALVANGTWINHSLTLRPLVSSLALTQKAYAPQATFKPETAESGEKIILGSSFGSLVVQCTLVVRYLFL